MSLISKNDLINASGLHKIGFLKNPVASAVMSVAKINEVNKLYDKLKDKEGKDFFDSFVRERNLSYIAFEEDLAKIPKTGPFILVSNQMKLKDMATVRDIRQVEGTVGIGNGPAMQGGDSHLHTGQRLLLFIVDGPGNCLGL